MPKRITIENAEMSLTFGNQAYSFPWVNSGSIQDPRENVLSISPQGQGDGVVYRNGITTPVLGDFVVREVPEDLFNAMKSAFENQDRVEMLLYDKNVGDQYTMGQSIIRSNPSNLNLSEGEETFDVMLNLSCAANRFGHKPPVDAA